MSTMYRDRQVCKPAHLTVTYIVDIYQMSY